MGNLIFNDAIVNNKLFKLCVNLLELHFTLFVDSHLLVDKLFHKIFKVGLGLGMVESLLFHRESRWVLNFGIWVKWRVQL